MKSVESENASSLLMAGAACRAATLAPPGRAMAARGARENCRLQARVSRHHLGQDPTRTQPGFDPNLATDPMGTLTDPE